MEQQQRYQKYLNEIESLQDKIKHDQVDYEKRQNEYEQQIQRRKEHVEQLKSDYVKLVKEIASKAVFARSGKSISNQVCRGPLFSHRLIDRLNEWNVTLIFIQDWRAPPRNFALVGIRSSPCHRFLPRPLQRLTLPLFIWSDRSFPLSLWMAPILNTVLVCSRKWRVIWPRYEKKKKSWSRYVWLILNGESIIHRWLFLGSSREYSIEESIAETWTTVEIQRRAGWRSSHDRFRTVEDWESNLQRKDRRAKWSNRSIFQIVLSSPLFF